MSAAQPNPFSTTNIAPFSGVNLDETFSSISSANPGGLIA